MLTCMAAFLLFLKSHENSANGKFSWFQGDGVTWVYTNHQDEGKIHHWAWGRKPEKSTVAMVQTGECLAEGKKFPILEKK